MCVQVWPAVQSGPPPPMPLNQPAPSAPFPVPPVPVVPQGHPSRQHHSHQQQHHPSTLVNPLVAGARCPITIGPLHNRTRSATHQACGHLTSSTMQVHMVTVKKAPKMLNPTSSLVGIHRSCALS